MKPWSHKPTLVSNDLVLRPYQSSDLDDIYRIIETKEIKYLTGTVISTHEMEKTLDKERVSMWYESLNEKDDRLDLMITYKGNVIGEIVLNEWDPEIDACSFRILMDPEQTSHGLGTKSMRMFLDYAFENLPLNRIELEVYEFNPRAKRAYEKVGFVYEGTKRKAFRIDDTYYDILFYAMLREDL